MAEQHVSFRDDIFFEAEFDSERPDVENRSRREGQTASRRKRLRDFLNGEESSSDELYRSGDSRSQERETIRGLRKRIRCLEARLDAMERRNDRLEDLLVDRLAPRFSTPSRQGRRSGPQVNGTNSPAPAAHSAHHRDISRPRTNASTEVNGTSSPPPADQSSHHGVVPRPQTSERSQGNGASSPASATQSTHYRIISPSDDTATSNVEPIESATLADLKDEDEVDMGGGVCISRRKWNQLLAASRDSLFCKGAVRLLWSTSELKDRSVTGQPCRRFGGEGKRALTPVKLKAVGNAFKVFVEKTPSRVPSAERLKKMNYYISELLNDIKK